MAETLGLTNNIGEDISKLNALHPEEIWKEEVDAREILWDYRGKTEHFILRNIRLKDSFLLCFRKPKTYSHPYNQHYLNYSIEKIPGLPDSIKEKALKAAKTRTPVLITGETGTGKEILARAIHKDGNSKDKFIPINCTAIPGELVESELFGYEPGAFTGANGGKPGKFQLADGGTLFLDEIADMPGDIQCKLLRVVEDKKVWRIGADSPEKTDFNMISATNANIKRLVDKGAFREDLYHRIATLIINLPPLRDRMEYFDELLYHFLHKHGGKNLNFPSEVMTTLKTYPWPGNIRELEQVINLLISECSTIGRVRLEDIPEKVKNDRCSHGNTLPDKLETLKRREVRRALKICNGNKKEAADLLGISRPGLYKMIDNLLD